MPMQSWEAGSKCWSTLCARYPKSRYARYAPDERLQIVPSAKGGGMMISMMNSLTNTSPGQIAGVFRDHAHWTEWEKLSGTVPPAQIFLASAPVSSSDHNVGPERSVP